MTASSPEVSGLTSDFWYLLTPITVISPCSIFLMRSAFDSTRRDFIYSIALIAPPMPSIKSNSASALSFNASTLRSTAGFSSKRSSYSNKSVSKAIICCIRRDHCWSHGRGNPKASFHAGNWTARARAFFDNVTASISIRIRYTLFSGCCSVRPRELTCTPYLKRRILGFSTPYLSRQI